MWELWVSNRKRRVHESYAQRKPRLKGEAKVRMVPVQPAKEEGKETDTTEAPSAWSSVTCFTHNLIYGADLGKYKKKTQHVLIADWNGETRDPLKRNTPVFQVWATKSKTKRKREMRKWNWFYTKKKKYVSDFRVVESEMSEEQHVTGNVQ